jgi:hypothetical protein
VIQHNVIDDNLSGMLLDCEGDVAEEDYDIFQDLFDDSEKRLCNGCKKYTKLFAVLKFFNLNANSRWSDTSFTGLLEFLMTCFRKVVRCMFRHTKRRNCCVQWQWTSKECKLVQMIVCCIETNIRIYMFVLHVVHHGTIAKIL